MITAFIAFSDSFVVPCLHVVNVSLSDELIEQGVSLLIAHFILNRYESVLEVHDSILQLHGAFWHVCLLPGSLNELLLPLNLRLRDVLC